MISPISEIKVMIAAIEAALGMKLYENQIKYIIGEIEQPNYDNDRATGKTTAYCIKLALSSGDPLDLRRPELFSDSVYSGITDRIGRYSKSFFLPEFMRIRKQLSKYGFAVRDVYIPKMTRGGFIVGD